MRARKVLCVIAMALCALVAAGCTREVPESGATPTPTPTHTPSPTSSPTPPPTEPFELELTKTSVDSMDNGAMLGRQPVEPDEAAATDAAEQALEVLGSYLNAQFVDEATRFSGDPITALLTAEALDRLDEEGRLALGELKLSADRVETGSSTAKARVMVSGEDVRAVTVTFEADLTAISGESESPISQHGSVIFSPTDDGWRVSFIDVALDVPDDGSPGEGEATPDAVESGGEDE